MDFDVVDPPVPSDVVKSWPLKMIPHGGCLDD